MKANAPAIGGASMAEITFDYFHKKYGSRTIVDEYMGSLVTTLACYEKVRLVCHAKPLQGAMVVKTSLLIILTFLQRAQPLQLFVSNFW